MLGLKHYFCPWPGLGPGAKGEAAAAGPSIHLHNARTPQAHPCLFDYVNMFIDVNDNKKKSKLTVVAQQKRKTKNNKKIDRMGLELATDASQVKRLNDCVGAVNHVVMSHLFWLAHVDFGIILQAAGDCSCVECATSVGQCMR